MGSILGWGSKILHATEQVSLHATARESMRCNARFHMMQERSHVLRRLQVSHQFYFLLGPGPKSPVYFRSQVAPFVDHGQHIQSLEDGAIYFFSVAAQFPFGWVGRHLFLSSAFFYPSPYALPSEACPASSYPHLLSSGQWDPFATTFAVVLILLKADGSFKRKASVLLILTALKMNVLDNLLLKAIL